MQLADLLLEALAHGGRRARRRALDAADQALDVGDLALDDVSQPAPLLGPGADHSVEGLAEALKHRLGALGGLRLALLGLDQLEHAAHVEQGLGARRAHRRRSAERIDRRQHLPQGDLVEPDLGLAVRALDAQVHGQAAAADAARHCLADARLEPLEPRRQAQPDIEAAPVHRAQLPMPAEEAGGPVRPRKTGHALDGHASTALLGIGGWALGIRDWGWECKS